MLTLELKIGTVPLSELSFLDVVETRPDEATARECAEVWVGDAYERITSQLDELAVLCRARSVRETHQGPLGVHEFTTFATRTSDCEQLEEVYTVYDEYSSRLSKYQQRTYCVTMLETDTTAGYRLICRDGQVQVRAVTDNGSEKIVTNETQREELLADFFQRSLVAVEREAGREGDEQIAADYDAYVKHLDYSYPGQYLRERKQAVAWLDAYTATTRRTDALARHVLTEHSDRMAS